MGITWIPLPNPSTVNANAAGVGDEWVSILKPDSVNTSITTTHTNSISCKVTHTVSPALPEGLTITNDATGITLSGDTRGVHSIDMTNTYSNPSGSTSGLILPTGAILTHYTPDPVFKFSWTITVTAEWTWLDIVVPVTSVYVNTYKFSVYNRWISDKTSVLTMLGK